MILSLLPSAVHNLLSLSSSLAVSFLRVSKSGIMVQINHMTVQPGDVNELISFQNLLLC